MRLLPRFFTIFGFHLDTGKVWLCTRGSYLASENLLEGEREEAYKAGMYSDNNCHDLI